MVKGVVSSEEGSNVKGIVDSRPSRVVAANLRLEAFSCGIRNWEVQPAPRIRMFTIVTESDHLLGLERSGGEMGRG